MQRKEELIKLIEEWQKKRPEFSRNRLAQATGIPYSILHTLDKEGSIKLPKKRPTTARDTPWGNKKVRI